MNGQYYRVELLSDSSTETLVSVGFGDLAENDKILPEAIAGLDALNLRGGKLVKFDGRMSVPIAMAFAHHVSHLYGAVAVNDPKLGKFVVAISHDPAFHPGMLLE